MIRFKFDPLDGMADRLERAAARGRFALAAVDAVNIVTKRANESLQRGEIRDINLSPAYVKSKTDMVLASPGSKARSEIVTKGDATVLGNFAPVSRIIAPGSMRRAGPVKGFRQAGTALAIRKSSYILEKQWFVMALRRGAQAGGNGFGVFVRDDSLPARNGPGAVSEGRHRDGKAGKRHLYGPAPYQLFKEQIRVQERSIQDDLERTALDRMGAELEKAFQ